MKILVSGGLGYIGSHTVVELLEKNHEVVIIDNLYNTKEEVHQKIMELTGKSCEFYPYDASDFDLIDNLCIMIT